MSLSTRTSLLLVPLAAAALLAGCEAPPMDSKQQGFRGTGMVQITNPRLAALKEEANVVPATLDPAAPGGPKAAQAFKNVQVLGDLSGGEFTRTMLAITEWVAPEQGCAYCHEGADFAADTLYTKQVARRMLQMTRHINSDWNNHVAQTGVTCYTCHRGKPVPANTWTIAPPSDHDGLYVGALNGQNLAASTVGYTSMPFDPFTLFLQQKGELRVVSDTALPTGSTRNIKQTEATYGLMMYISGALGENCTFCHNSRSFKEWEQSSPPRITAWHGIRMVRDLNVTYIDPLKSVLPPKRLGPLGDAPKAACATCHQGVNKPLYGAAMAKEYPAMGLAPAGAAPAKSAAASDAIGKVLFATGKSEMSGDAQQQIAAAAQYLTAHAGSNVALSGYADKTGNAQQNLELAKQRAYAVRDALRSAGVAEQRIELRKPQFVIGEAVADARRVDILAVQ